MDGLKKMSRRSDWNPFGFTDRPVGWDSPDVIRIYNPNQMKPHAGTTRHDLATIPEAIQTRMTGSAGAASEAAFENSSVGGVAGGPLVPGHGCRDVAVTPELMSSVLAAIGQMVGAHGDGGAHRTKYPVRTQQAIAPELPPGDARSMMTLRQWYESEQGPRFERQRRIDNGRNKSGTMDKDVSALAYWERLTNNPALQDINAEVATSFVAAAIKDGSRSTAKGYVGHVRWMLNEAKRARLIEETPAFEFPKVSRRTATAADYRQTVIYERNGDLLTTLADIYQNIECRELRIAFLCGASFGPRTEDLLLLPWSAFDLHGERPAVRFVAEKTGTFHVVPLAAWLVEHLARHRAITSGDHVFPNLISHAAKEPKKSRACRRTVKDLKSAAIAAGFDFDGRPSKEQKPFQVLRATCNERYERHSRRAGEWILGHGMGSVNRASYQNPGSEIYDAVNTLPQPEAFTDVV